MDELFVIRKALSSHNVRTRGMVFDAAGLAHKLQKIDRLLGALPEMACGGKKKKGKKK